MKNRMLIETNASEPYIVFLNEDDSPYRSYVNFKGNITLHRDDVIIYKSERDTKKYVGIYKGKDVVSREKYLLFEDYILSDSYKKLEKSNYIYKIYDLHLNNTNLENLIDLL